MEEQGLNVDQLAITLEPVPMALTAFFGIFLALMILALAFEEKLHAKKSVIVGVFAIVSLWLGSAFGLIPFGAILLPNGHELEMPVYIPAIDWQVIAIIVGSSIFVDVTSKSGLFSWIAIRLTKTSAGDPLRLLWYYGVLTVVFSAVLNNVTAMIIIGSLTVVSLTKLEKQNLLIGFLLIEGLLTNLGGLLTLISSVPNIILGGTAGISFIAFFLKAAPYVLVVTVVTIYLGAKLFAIKSLTAEEKATAAQLVSGFDEDDGIESRRFFWFSTVLLVAFILTIATTSVLPVIRDLGMGFVALTYATIMLVTYKAEADTFYKAVDWDLIGFFLGLFVVINVMEYAGVLDAIGIVIRFMIGDGESALGTGVLLVATSVFSSVTDNIPLAAMLAKILSGMATPTESNLWWAVVFGANLGGNLTPIGSASTLVAVAIMHKHGLPLSFLDFVKRAAPFAVIQIVLATAYVLVV
jgi:Na+/H+ antiporter NhaD/arsenite permease-like protein